VVHQPEKGRNSRERTSLSIFQGAGRSRKSLEEGAVKERKGFGLGGGGGGWGGWGGIFFWGVGGGGGGWGGGGVGGGGGFCWGGGGGWGGWGLFWLVFGWFGGVGTRRDAVFLRHGETSDRKTDSHEERYESLGGAVRYASNVRSGVKNSTTKKEEEYAV